MNDTPPTPVETRTLALGDPSVLAYLPMLYVAWADSELAPEEIRALASRLTTDQDLGCACRDFWGAWLDPVRPPSAEDLQEVLEVVREAGGNLPRRGRESLVDLGLRMARAAGEEPNAAEQRALTEIEAALGIASAEAVRSLLRAGREESAEREPATTLPVPEREALVALLDGEHASLRREVRELLASGGLTPPPDLARDEYREWVLDRCRELASRGYGALSYPQAVGGGGDMAAFVAVFETLALGDLSLLVKLGVQFGLFGGSVLQLGSADHHRRYLPAIGRLELPGCFAMTETGHGSNVADIETAAVHDPATDEIVVHTPHERARKDYIGNAARHGRLATVFAQLSVGGNQHGVHAVLVPIRNEDGTSAPGVRIEDCGGKLGLEGVDNGRLWFDRVRVPRTNLLDRFGGIDDRGRYHSPIASPSKRFFTMLATLVGGRVSVALAGLSASKVALTIALRYAAHRRQFGAAGESESVLLDYPTHRQRLLPRLATTVCLHFALRDLARRYAGQEEGERRTVESLAAGLKAFATRHATDTIQACREACGGQGYLSANRFAALKADTDVFTTFEGDNTVLLQLVAKGLLSGFKRQFSDMSPWRLLGYLAERASVAVAELNPLVTRRTDEDHLRDREMHFAAFRWREEHLVSTLARRLKKRIDAGQDTFEAFLECQGHAVAAAEAHVERIILEVATGAVSGVDGDLGRTLSVVVDFFAVSRLAEDRGFFLEHGYFEPGKAKAVRKLGERLATQLAPLAVELTDGFAVPEPLLPELVRR